MPETAFNPEVDIDPNDAISLGYDPSTDTHDDPLNDQGHPYEPEPVEGAMPVDDAVADVLVPTIKED